MRVGVIQVSNVILHDLLKLPSWVDVLGVRRTREGAASDYFDVVITGAWIPETPSDGHLAGDDLPLVTPIYRKDEEGTRLLRLEGLDT